MRKPYPPEFDVQISDSVTEIGETVWNDLGAGAPFQSARWYGFGEHALSACRPIHILLSQAGKAIARASFWITPDEPMPVPEPIRTILRLFFKRWPLMICRVPIVDLSGLVLPADIALRTAALNALSCAAQQEASRHKISFILFPYLEAELAQAPGWAPEFSAVDLPGPGTRLQIIWPDFESYLRQLSRSTRANYRSHARHAAEQDIQVQRGKTIAAPERIVPFIRNVEKHHRSAPNLRASAILENASMVDASLCTITARGLPVGYGLTFKEAENSVLSLMGLDYNTSYVYFQLVYDGIRHAIENHSKVLLGGTGAYQFKQSMGFELTTNTWAVFAGRHPVVQKIGLSLGKWAS